MKIPLPLDKTTKQPLYRQIYQRIKQAILSGQLTANERMPSIRTLASELGLARATVEQAYGLLITEGLLEPQGQAGTFVTQHNYQPTTNKQQHLDKVRAYQIPQTNDKNLPFQLGIPALDEFPMGLWNKTVNQSVRQFSRQLMSYPSLTGYLPLKQAIANYLHISRGIECHPEQLFITAGYPATLELIIKALFSQQDAIYLEDPHYFVPQLLFKQAKIPIIPVPVDEQGFNIKQAYQLNSNCHFALVTPSHQSPLTLSLSLTRRLALLEWANTTQSWIIEDDYDGEFHYQGAPLPSLKSLDKADKVLYCGSFSKVLFPALRLAYLVIPEQLIPQFNQVLIHQPANTLYQAVVSRFINEGHFYRHLKKMRNLYKQRRHLLCQQLAVNFPASTLIDNQLGGMHIIVRPPQPYQASIITTLAKSQQLAVQSLADWYLSPPSQQALLLGFTNCKDDHTTQQAVKLLADCLTASLA